MTKRNIGEETLDGIRSIKRGEGKKREISEPDIKKEGSDMKNGGVDSLLIMAGKIKQKELNEMQIEAVDSVDARNFAYRLALEIKFGSREISNGEVSSTLRRLVERDLPPPKEILLYVAFLLDGKPTGLWKEGEERKRKRGRKKEIYSEDEILRRLGRSRLWGEYYDLRASEKDFPGSVGLLGLTHEEALEKMSSGYLPLNKRPEGYRQSKNKGWGFDSRTIWEAIKPAK